MKERFYMFERSGVYYVEDAVTERQQSLKTKDGVEAQRIVHAKNEAVRCPMLNVAMGSRERFRPLGGSRRKLAQGK